MKERKQERKKERKKEKQRKKEIWDVLGFLRANSIDTYIAV